MSEECSHNCESSGKDCGERSKESLMEKLCNGSHVKKVVGVISGKGGVGKSFVTSLLAVMPQRRLSGGHSRRRYNRPVHSTGVWPAHPRREYGIRPLPGELQDRDPRRSLNLLMEHETDPVV